MFLERFVAKVRKKIILEKACIKPNYKTEIESVQLGYTYIADMDKCPQDKCAETNVVVRVVICCICSKDPLFKV